MSDIDDFDGEGCGGDLADPLAGVSFDDADCDMGIEERKEKIRKAFEARHGYRQSLINFLMEESRKERRLKETDCLVLKMNGSDKEHRREHEKRERMFYRCAAYIRCVDEHFMSVGMGDYDEDACEPFDDDEEGDES